MTDRSIHFYSLLRRYIPASTTLWLLIVIGLIVISAIHLSYPWLLKVLIDYATSATSHRVDLILLVPIFAAVYAAGAVLSYRIDVWLQHAGMEFRNGLRRDLLMVHLGTPLDSARFQRAGQLSSQFSEDVGQLHALLSDTLAPLMKNALFICGCLTVMLYLHPIASFGALVLMGGTLPAAQFLARRMKDYARHAQEKHALAHAVFEEALVGIREIQAAAAEQEIRKRYVAIQNEATSIEKKASRIMPFVNHGIYLMATTLLLTVFGISVSNPDFFGQSTGTGVAFYLYAYAMMMTSVSTARHVMTYTRQKATIQGLTDLLQEGSSNRVQRRYSAPVRGQVVCDDVTFGYQNERPVFERFSVTIAEGEWVTIEGPSGSGKSTLAHLILGFHSVQRGCIRIDGIDINEWRLQNLREQIGFVGQDPYLFSGTLLENICFPSRAVDPERMERVLDLCCLREMLDELPAGLETPIGERGFTVSGGQRARIALARAVLHDPPLLILDEATAMLETELEERIWNNLINDRSAKTTIILGHRVETFQMAHQRIHLGSLVNQSDAHRLL